MTFTRNNDEDYSLVGYHPECVHCESSGKVTYRGEQYECPVCLGHGKLLGTTVYPDKEAK